MEFKWAIVFLLVLNFVVSGLSNQHQHHRRRHHTSNISSNNNDNTNEDTTNNRSYTNNHDNKLTGINEKTREYFKNDDRVSIPYSKQIVEKMLKKAIKKIIMGNLTTSDMYMLRSMNFTTEEIYAIRAKLEAEKKRDKMIEIERERLRLREKILEKKKRDKFQEQPINDETSEFAAYNRQAVMDYEYLANKMELQQNRSESDFKDYDDGGDNVSKESKKYVTEDEINEEYDNSAPENIRRRFDKAMAPHTIFKIPPYGDSEFDSSSSEEKSKSFLNEPNLQFLNSNNDHDKSSFDKEEDKITNNANFFHSSTFTVSPIHSSSSSFSSSPVSLTYPSTLSLDPIVHRLHHHNRTKSNFLDKTYDLDLNNYPETIRETNTKDSINVIDIDSLTNSSKIVDNNVNYQELRNNDSKSDKTNDQVDDHDSTQSWTKHINEYEGLEWVQDDVFRVIPSLVDSFADYAEDSEPEEYDNDASSFKQSRVTRENEEDDDTDEYQNDNYEANRFITANPNSTSMGNQSFVTYQQMVQAHRKGGNLTSTFDSQGQKAMEDIKSKVLTFTGRGNLVPNTNKIQREKLTSFLPTCQMPRNTEPEAWSDPFSMNMHFRLNLTSDEHVSTARLRIYKLPQDNLTLSSSSPTNGGSTVDEQEEEDVKRIRISAYRYTKSLRKHRAKKRLMDSLVVSLTREGVHLTLNVEEGLRFWRLNPRYPHGNGGNHGLVIQVEDQDGRPLKPALYIQEPSCSNGDDDHKAFNYLPALFVRACTRYVRVVNGKTHIKELCRH